MTASGLLWQAPVIAVWLVGAGLAIGRWRRHPAVSTRVLVSVALLIAAAIGQQVAFDWVIRDASTSDYEIAVRLRIISVTSISIRAVALVTMLIAVFWWREEPARQTRPMQFNILGLLVLTLAVAIVCGVVRGLIDTLGEITFVLNSLLEEIPLALGWFLGGVLAWTRWSSQPVVARLVLAAITLQMLALLLSLGTIAWMLQFGTTTSSSLVLSLNWLAIGPLSWALLITAALGGRTKPAELSLAAAGSAGPHDIATPR